MLKKIFATVLLSVAVLSSSASAASTDWTLLKGSKLNGEWSTPDIRDSADGIQIKGKGSYDSAEGSAAGLVLTAAVNPESFTAEIRADQVAGLRSEGADHWFNFNLLNKPAFFSLDHPNQAEGLVVLMRPYDAKQVEVEAYLLSPGSGFMGLGSSKVDWDKQLKIEVKAGEGTFSVNGQTIDADLSKLPGDLFVDGQAYFSTGASSQGDAAYAYTLKSVNGSAVSLEGGAAASAAAGEPSGPIANPKTGDAGFGVYPVLAAAALGVLALTALIGRKTARKQGINA